MVLEEAAAAPADSFADSPSPSDSDPYASPQDSSSGATQNGPLTIRFDEMPKPIPILGPLMGYTGRHQVRRVTQFLGQTQNKLHRPMTHDEVNMLAYYISKMNSWTSYGAAAGAIAGSYRCYQTRASFAFPFYNPWNSTFDPNFLGPLRGQQARLAYHMMRFPIWYLFGIWAGEFLGQIVATVVVTRQSRADPKSQQLMEELGVAKSIRQKAYNQQRAGEAKNKQDASDGQDDMSPAVQGPGVTDTDVLSDDQARIQEFRQQAGPSRGATENRANTFDMSRVTSQQASYDDASPTGGSGPMDSAYGTGGGSSWDRLRQQASAGREQSARSSAGGFGRPVQKEQSSGSTMGDSFSFSSSDEERQLAKTEAKRDFDARVDKERNGGDFEDSGKKW
ncbi:hypothetical protein K490DRAFT_38424 [Saccharata proteae CBS 121410]|uniref:Uncharacterized protein n=1 Tax=Saccharata proteae CBS 121410 TaxID=1314787 RepID=A0A6A5YAW4_9PEZI|nr:hypothetical protein K490DRAFT_38424 [Saccharata proteae CBS 121410]